MGVSPEEESPSRTLIYFPIVHNQADMGALSESVKKASVKKVGRPGWKRKLHLIDRLWTDIEKSIKRLSISFDRVRLYQDGLPVSGRKEGIVEELAKSGSRNHALLLRLIDQGARLMGTESPELLVAEYELAKRAFELVESRGKGDLQGSEGTNLLERRDRFIARQINDTLLPGEVGIIFLGMLHSLEPWLDKDIRVIYPVHRPLKP